MTKILGKEVKTIKCFDDLNDLTGNANLILDIDFDEALPENAEYFIEAKDRIKFTKLHGETIGYKSEPLRHPDLYIGWRHDKHLKKLCSLISQGSTVSFGLSADNKLNILYCLKLMSVLPVYSKSNSLDYDEYTECEPCKISLRLHFLSTPCLIGYKSVGANKELQWSLRWSPQLEDIQRSCEDRWDIERCSDWPQPDSSQYREMSDRDSMFVLTADDIACFKADKTILKRDEGSFASAFVIKAADGRLIVAPEHCKKNIVAQVLKETEKIEVTESPKTKAAGNDEIIKHLEKSHNEIMKAHNHTHGKVAMVPQMVHENQTEEGKAFVQTMGMVKAIGVNPEEAAVFRAYFYDGLNHRSQSEVVRITKLSIGKVRLRAISFNQKAGRELIVWNRVAKRGIDYEAGPEQTKGWELEKSMLLNEAD